MDLNAPDAGDADRHDVTASVEEPSRFRVVFERHVDGIYRYLSRRVGVVLAEDLAGETFAIAFRQRHRYDPRRASCRAWLLGIATNLVRRHHRDEARRLSAYQRVAATDGGPLPDDASERIGDFARLDAALARIDPDLRDVILLVGAADLTYQDAASALAIPIGTVRSRMWRARRDLRVALVDIEGRSDGTGERAVSHGLGIGRCQP